MIQRNLPISRYPSLTYTEIQKQRKPLYKSRKKNLIKEASLLLEQLNGGNTSDNLLARLNQISLELHTFDEIWADFSTECFTLFLHAPKKPLDKSLRELNASFKKAKKKLKRRKDLMKLLKSSGG